MLVTLSEVKTYLQIEHAEDDPWFTQQIPFAEAALLEMVPNVVFLPKPGLTELHDGGTDALILKRPVTAVTSVTPDTGAGTPLEATDLDLYPEAGLLYRADRRPWLKRRRYWQVVYDAGFTAVPADIKLAIILLITRRHQRRDTGLESERVGDWSYKVDPEDRVLRRLLAPYQDGF